MYFNWGGTETLLQSFALIETRGNDSRVRKITPRGKYRGVNRVCVLYCYLFDSVYYSIYTTNPIIPQLTGHAAC